MEKKIIVAIDGYSSCGKSTMAKTLAKEIGYTYIDTGAMYRAVTLFALQHGVIDAQGHIDHDALLSALPNIRISFRNDSNGTPELLLNDQPVEGEIRQMRVAQHVSQIAAIPEVRSALTAQQQLIGKSGGVVMDGRDIGTVVFPQAELKLFITADPKVRAERRLLELRSKGDQMTSFEEVLHNIEERDYQDTHRAVSPLVQAPDAIVVDNSLLSREEQNLRLRQIFDEIRQRYNG